MLYAFALLTFYLLFFPCFSLRSYEIAGLCVVWEVFELGSDHGMRYEWRWMFSQMLENKYFLNDYHCRDFVLITMFSMRPEPDQCSPSSAICHPNIIPQHFENVVSNLFISLNTIFCTCTLTISDDFVSQ